MTKLLEKFGSKTEEHEFFTPIPKGYKTGKTKYVVCTGTVMSGLGKGIFMASLAKLLKYKGLNVSPIKFDGYLNVDAGTLNPFRHGEVFVLDDGTESDMDLGTYERFLDINIDKDNYLTGGKLFKRILDRERKGNYLGRDVQFIPHVTGEIKGFVRQLAMKRKADVIMLEVGGTVGDIENNYIIEAMRELAYEEGHENVCFVNLTYVMKPNALAEQKSKAAQLGIRSLLGLGVQPHIIGIRADEEVTEKVREKISIFSNVPLQRVIGVPDCESIYSIPLTLKKNKIDSAVMDVLKIKPKNKTSEEKKLLNEWSKFVKKRLSLKGEITIGITGKYTGLRDSYASILKSLEHAGVANDVKVNVKWVETTKIEQGKLKVENALKDVNGIIVPGGFGKRGAEGKIACVQYARENKIPYLGLCYGFQMALIEFARNVCNLKDAHTTETDPNAKHPVVDILPEQISLETMGGNMRLGGHNIQVKPGTKAYESLGNKKSVRLRFRHRYECNPKYIATFEKHGMIFSGKAPNRPIMQILELQDHPFFIGTQSHPEFSSRPLRPQPFYRDFVKAAKNIKR